MLSSLILLPQFQIPYCTRLYDWFAIPIGCRFVRRVAWLVGWFGQRYTTNELARRDGIEILCVIKTLGGNVYV